MRIVPANEASFEDLQTVFGTRGAAAYCQCQRYKLRPREAAETVTWDEIHVGTPSMFAAAGLAEVSRPTKRRTVMRIDFEKGTAG